MSPYLWKNKQRIKSISDWIPLLRKFNPSTFSQEIQENGILGASKYIIGDLISIDDIDAFILNMKDEIENNINLNLEDDIW